jgi:hypothetical protein
MRTPPDPPQRYLAVSGRCGLLAPIQRFVLAIPARLTSERRGSRHDKSPGG